MNPRQKLDLIELHQQNGAVVAMTGDGVNDAPALKKADVGIAMGVRGTEVAKEAADMILKDDAFASIVMAIQQGRIIFENIRKFVLYLLSCNLSEVLVVTLCILAGLPLPLLPLQILFLNFITDVFPALALGFGKGESDSLNHPPRPKSEGILKPSHWWAIIGYACMMTTAVIAAFLWALAQPDKSADYANSIAFLTLALGQLWHVFNMRSSSSALLNNQVVRNPFIWGAIVLCLLLIGVALYWQPLAQVLHVTLLDRQGWMVVLSASLFPLIVGQIVLMSASKLTNRH
jgi:P-type Ca2+ transporter type 2C